MTKYRVIMEATICMTVDANSEDDAKAAAYDWIGETEIPRDEWAIARVFEVVPK